MQKLRTLTLSGGDIKDLAFLKTNTNLEVFNLDYNLIEDISDITNLTNLDNLKLEFNKIQDISGIASLTNLMSLEIGVNDITNIPDLSNLQSLMRLRISDSVYMTNADVEQLSTLKSLVFLEIGSALGWRESKLIDDISPLSGFTFRYLDLSDNLIADVSPLATATEYYNLMGNRISDISTLTLPSRVNFYADNQEITIPTVQLGDSTALRIYDNSNVVPGLSWVTNGDYGNDTLTWETIGAMELSFASSNHNFSGIIKQEVILNEIKYDLSFDLNGGQGQILEEGAKAKVVSEPTRSMYRFNGWNTKADGTGTNWIFNSTTMPASNITLYAQWVKVKDNEKLPDTGMMDTTLMTGLLMVLGGTMLSKENAQSNKVSY